MTLVAIKRNNAQEANTEADLKRSEVASIIIQVYGWRTVDVTEISFEQVAKPGEKPALLTKEAAFLKASVPRMVKAVLNDSSILFSDTVFEHFT